MTETVKQEMSVTGLALHGAAIIDEGNPTDLIDVSLGIHDKPVSVFLYFGHYKKYPDSVEQALSDDAVQTTLQAFKNDIMMVVQNVVNKGVKEEARIERGRKIKEAKKRVRELSAQNAAGSVSELSAKYGVSKSEIRRMRAAGTLDDYIKGRKNG